MNTEAFAKERPAARYYLIGNSLTWDTLPPLLSGDVQCTSIAGQVCRSCLPIPACRASRGPPSGHGPARKAIRRRLGSAPLRFDADAGCRKPFSAWMKLQPKAVFVIHFGWAKHAQHVDEFGGYARRNKWCTIRVFPRAMRRTPARPSGRVIRQTLAQNLSRRSPRSRRRSRTSPNCIATKFT